MAAAVHTGKSVEFEFCLRTSAADKVIFFYTGWIYEAVYIAGVHLWLQEQRIAGEFCAVILPTVT